MTELQYKELQAWCQKNKKHKDYQWMVLLRNEATSIRRQVIAFKVQIQRDSLILDQCKDEDKKAKWLSIIEKHKQERDKHMEEFKKLPSCMHE